VIEDQDSFTDDERTRVSAAAGTSHAVFVREVDGAYVLRFFTTKGELPACGHGTVAAVALLAERSGGNDFQVRLRTATRRFEGRAVRERGRLTASFDFGPVSLRAAEAEEVGAITAQLAIAAGQVTGEVCVASVGRARMLLPVASRAALATLAPDFEQLKEACDRLGFLGCYVYSIPEANGMSAARMFAPSIGVPEDIANANSTGCLAAYLAEHGLARLSVDMGDHLGIPATITATVPSDPTGYRVRLGGEAACTGSVSV
jgi:trans-2,3-dihydro-3-hydroxyanthranilate isomerase